MPNRREAALVLAMCSVVKKRIAAIEERAKLIAGVELPRERVCATVDGKVVVATTGRYTKRPRERFTVLDNTGFVNWVAARWPTEVEAVPAIRPAFVEWLAEKARSKNGVLVDDDGEVCDFVKLNDDEAYIATYLAPGGADMLGPLLAEQTLDDLGRFIEEREQ